MPPMIMPPNSAIVPNSGISGCMFGARNSNNAPNMMSANPPLFFDLLCSE